MTIYEQLKSRSNENFINSLLPGRRQISIRPGYYYVKGFEYKPIKPFGQIAIGQVNWKSNPDDYFIEDLTFEVALSTLHSLPPDEVNSEFYNDLIGKVIYVHQPFFKTRIIEGVERDVLSCQWDFVNDVPLFINEQNAAIIAFVGSAKTLIEANINFQANANYDFAEAEFQEAECGYSVDVVIEEFEENELDLFEEAEDDSFIEDIPGDDDDETSNHLDENHES